MMIDTSTRCTHQVHGKIGHFLIKVCVQGLYIRKFKGELFLLLLQLGEAVIKLFQPETISCNCKMLYLSIVTVATSSALRARCDSKVALASLRYFDIRWAFRIRCLDFCCGLRTLCPATIRAFLGNDCWRSSPGYDGAFRFGGS